MNATHDIILMQLEKGMSSHGAVEWQRWRKSEVCDLVKIRDKHPLSYVMYHALSVYNHQKFLI